MPVEAIVTGLRLRHTNARVIGFPKGAGHYLIDFAARTGINALGLDSSADPRWAAKAFDRDLVLQGNLDPLALAAGGPALETGVRQILSAFRGRPHIFNLGHGVLPHTPIQHVEIMLDFLRRGCRPNEQSLSLAQGAAYFGGNFLDGGDALSAAPFRLSCRGAARLPRKRRTFVVMERRLMRAIMLPALLVTWITGLTLAVQAGFLHAGWFHTKFALVIALSALHGYFAKLRKDLAEERNRRGSRFFRIVNEVPTILMAGIVILVVFKPF